MQLQPMSIQIERIRKERRKGIWNGTIHEWCNHGIYLCAVAVVIVCVFVNYNDSNIVFEQSSTLKGNKEIN